ncbi:MAG: hypothetical protein Q8Q14_03955 [Gemmatimonadales bacterium]|nr:hypothetical protein [Gemmatimonadales bacterium]
MNYEGLIARVEAAKAAKATSDKAAGLRAIIDETLPAAYNCEHDHASISNRADTIDSLDERYRPRGETWVQAHDTGGRTASVSCVDCGQSVVWKRPPSDEDLARTTAWLAGGSA